MYLILKLTNMIYLKKCLLVLLQLLCITPVIFGNEKVLKTLKKYKVFLLINLSLDFRENDKKIIIVK